MEVAAGHISYFLTFTGFGDYLQCFYIHRMYDEAIVIVECETRSVRIPAVTYVPFFYLAQRGTDAVSVTGRTCFPKEGLYGGAEQQPVAIRRINSSEISKFGDIPLLGDTVQWHP